LFLLFILFLYWWRAASKSGWFVINNPFFFPLISLSYLGKSILILIVVGVSDLVIFVLIFDLCPFLF